jgi:hypothetical protein
LIVWSSQKEPYKHPSKCTHTHTTDAFQQNPGTPKTKEGTVLNAGDWVESMVRRLTESLIYDFHAIKKVVPAVYWPCLPRKGYCI